MSYADYDTRDAPRRHKSHRSRRERPVVYEEEEVIEARGKEAPRAARQMELMRRPHDDSSDSVEEVQRDFPPNGAYRERRSAKHGPPRRARSAHDRGYDDYSEEDTRRSKRSDKRRSRKYVSESDSYSDSPPPRKDRGDRGDRRKSLGEQALTALGLGGAAGALASGGGRDKSRTRDRSRDRGGRSSGGRSGRRRSYSSDSSDSRSRSVTRNNKISQAVKAAATAGAAEAWRSRKEPGGWTGAKGQRILTAAIGAGGIDGALSGKDPDKKGTRHTIEAVIGGLAGNRLLNGPRSRSRSRGRHDRGDKGGGGSNALKGLAAGGLAAAAGKAFMDHRDRSKSRGRRYSSSDSSRSPPRNKRSKSVTDYVRGGIAKLGLGGDKRRDSSSSSDRYSKRSSRRDRGVDDRQPRLRGGGGEQMENHSRSSSSSTTSIDDDEINHERKKRHRAPLLTAGLASVATIHAASSVYKSYTGRVKRRQEVADGTMSPEEAKKKRQRATLQDAASIGIAAIGVKSMVSEWKEMMEQRHECAEWEHEIEEKRAKVEERRKRRMSMRSSEPNLNQNYQDGNPYGSGRLPPPPMGPPPSR